MLLVHRLYALNALARAAIAVCLTVLGVALIAAGTLGVLAIVPILLAFAVANRLVPGGRMTLAPMASNATQGNPRQHRVPFTVAAAALLGLAIAFIAADRRLVAGVLGAAAVCVSVLADALAAA